MKIDPNNAIPTFNGHPAGGPERSSAKGPSRGCQPMKENGSSAEQLDLHVRNFLDCVKIAAAANLRRRGGPSVTAVACHLANISLRVGRKVRWNPEKEEIPGDPEAAAMLERPYRKPWDDVLRSLQL